MQKTIKHKREYAALLEERVVRRAREDFLTFYQYLYPEFDINWHHELICKEYQRLVDEDEQHLAISMPPGHAKSFLTNLFVAWCLGRDPSLRIIISSYSDRLVRRNCSEIKKVVESPSFSKVFPNIEIDYNDTETSKEFHIKGHRGYLIAEPAGGQITGFRADLLVVDDPYKGMADARSETKNETIKEWYDAIFRSRGHSSTKEIVIHTRWTPQDLIGWLLAREGSDWVNIVLPALKEGRETEHPDDPRDVGDPLWPEMVDKETLEKRKKNSSHIFFAVYQQRPTPRGGAIIKLHQIKKFPSRKAIDHNNATDIIQSWDLRAGGKKNKSTSYAVGQLWALIDANSYLLDQVRGKWMPDETLEMIKATNEHDLWKKAGAILIEKKADGITAISLLNKHIAGIVPVNPQGTKEARLEAVQPYFAAGNVHIIADQEWTPDWIGEVTSFSGQSTGSDDQVDACSQALNYLYNREKDPEVTVLF